MRLSDDSVNAVRDATASFVAYMHSQRLRSFSLWTTSDHFRHQLL